ncbi:MAG: hypothetical protein JO213_17960 [Alphaproteobacteria bacterium]|nr:hypothetical protein [Alphaproteobacteria bacterium]
MAQDVLITSGRAAASTVHPTHGPAFNHRLQEKTKIDVYCHAALKAKLETWRASQKVLGATILTRYDGKPLSCNRVRNKTTEILSAIDCRHLPLRDLRRKAATKLAEAGSTTPQIASITGHSIERCQRILDTYVVKTRAPPRPPSRGWTRSSLPSAVRRNGYYLWPPIIVTRSLAAELFHGKHPAFSCAAASFSTPDPSRHLVRDNRIRHVFS